MNILILTGRLVKDPEVKITPNEKTVATFTLAVNRPFDKENADFINCAVWGKTAEVVGNNLSKGGHIGVEGRLQIRKYTNKQGENRYATECIVSRVEFLESKGSAKAEPPKEKSTMESFGEEEIPF